MADTASHASRLDNEDLARRCAEICEDRQARKIMLYDVRGASIITDYYLICSGSSEPHVKAICNQIQRSLADEGIRPARIDGASDSRWIVMDYGTVLIHIFHTRLREYYQIEELWDQTRLIYDSEAVAAGPAAGTGDR
jgi:ribosome-associated protein